MNHEKPSYQTLEFWLSFAAMIVGALLASGVLPADSEALRIVGFIGTALGGLGYTGFRTAQKNTAANLKAALSDKPADPS